MKRDFLIISGMVATTLAIILLMVLESAGYLENYGHFSGGAQIIRASQIANVEVSVATKTPEIDIATTSIVEKKEAKLIPPPSYQARPLPNYNLAEGMISINFDDGFSSAFKNGMPILKEAGFPSTHYIITDYLNHTGYINVADVLALELAGHEIGSHTLNHPHLSKLNQKQLRSEIFESKKKLLNLGVKSVTTFAYPYGDYGGEAVFEVERAGYQGAFAINGGMVDPNLGRYLIDRLGIYPAKSLTVIKKDIDLAIKEKKWLILVFHRIDEDGNPISIRHEEFQEIINYLKEVKVKIVTNAEGLKILEN